MTEIALSELYVYPIKSAGGIALKEATLDAPGLRYDRRWMLIDEAGSFMSQRRFPRMALISVRFSSGYLLVDAPGMSTLGVPLRPEAERCVRVRVFEDPTEGALVGEEADRWFAELLGVSCRLAHMPEDAVRPVDPEYATDGDQVSFADAFPFLLVSEASLAELNDRLEEPIPVDRFRPNLVIRGCQPFAEDRWERVKIGAVPFRVAKPCARCVITTVDQATGVRGKEPLRILARYRRVGKGVLFGQYLIHDACGTLNVGDTLEVIPNSGGLSEAAISEQG